MHSLVRNDRDVSFWDDGLIHFDVDEILNAGDQEHDDGRNKELHKLITAKSEGQSGTIKLEVEDQVKQHKREGLRESQRTTDVGMGKLNE